MSLSREEYLFMMEQQRLLAMYVEEITDGEFLLMAMRQRHPDLSLVTTNDVRSDKTCFSIHDPGSLLTIYYRNASVRFVGDRWEDVGQVTIRLRLGKYGRVLQERVEIEYSVVTMDGIVELAQQYNHDS